MFLQPTGLEGDLPQQVATFAFYADDKAALKIPFTQTGATMAKHVSTGQKPL